MSIEVEGKTIQTDEEGFLLDPNDWDECVTEAIAARQGIELTDVHWALVNYFRTFYEDHMRHPSMHEWVLSLGRFHGKPYRDAKTYRDYLYALFPGGPIPTLCKLAGLPKPVEDMEE
jgi:tRNA 2-thiouridine synthesizing protein E